MRNDLSDQHRTLSQNSKCCIHCRNLSMPCIYPTTRPNMTSMPVCPSHATPHVTHSLPLRIETPPTSLTTYPSLHSPCASYKPSHIPNTYISTPPPPAPRTSPVSPLPVPAYTHSPSVSHTCPNAPFSPPPFPSKPSYHSSNAQPLPNLYLPPLAPSSSSSGRSPLSAVGPPASHTLQDWRRCLAIFLKVTTLPLYWQLTLLPTPPPTSTPTRPTPSAPPAPSSTQTPSPPHPQPCPHRLLPRHPLPQLPPPQPCKTARDGRSSFRIGYPVSASPTLPPPVLQPPSRPARPTIPDEDALRRHLQATVLAREPHSPFLSPMHHTFIPHQTSSRHAQPLTPLIPTSQVLNHSPLVPHKPLLPVSPHVPMRKLSFIHIQMIHSLFHQLLPSAPVAR